MQEYGTNPERNYFARKRQRNIGLSIAEDYGVLRYCFLSLFIASGRFRSSVAFPSAPI